MPQIDSLNRRLQGYLDSKLAEFQVETLYAYQLGPIGATIGAHGVTNVWQGIPVIPLAETTDEIHAVCMVPHNADMKNHIYLRWLFLPNNNASGLTIVTTIDKVDMGRDLTGSDVAADGATALDTVIPAITDSETTASVPFASDWGKIKGVAKANFYDALFIKMVASAQSGADRLRVFGLQVAFHKRKFASYLQS